MSNFSRIRSRLWMLILGVALGFLIGTDCLGIRRVVYMTDLFAEPLKFDAGSPTGYAGGNRELIVPGRNNDTYHVIAQTQQMLTQGEWRVRKVDYDNAPFGREVNSSSLYRWGLGLLAWVDYYVLSGRPLALSVERVALLADPLLHLLLLIGTTSLVGRRFGAWPAALLGAGLATLFPFAGDFAPGAPDDQGLVQICTIWSVLSLLLGVASVPAATSRPLREITAQDCARASRQRRRWFVVAGVVGGIGLWISVSSLAPILVGIAGGALLSAWVARGARAKDDPVSIAEAPPWRLWALSGAGTLLLAYLIEYFPTHLGSWQLSFVHPLYGLAWLGGGELLARAVKWIQGEKLPRKLREIGAMVVALVFVAAVPVIMATTREEGFLTMTTSSFRLTKLPGAPVEPSLRAWFSDGMNSPQAWLTVLPTLILGLAGWLIFRRNTSANLRASLALIVGPAFVAVGFACWRLSWWNNFDAVSLVLLIPLILALSEAVVLRPARWVASGFLGLVLFLGAFQLIASVRADRKNNLNEAEIIGLIDRDLGHWLAKRAGPEGAIILAPPRETTALFYYGGLRGLGTLAWENQDGISAAVRVVSASTPEEAKELFDRRRINYIVIPSWDTYLDEYARMGMGQLGGTFLSRVHAWRLPPWLQPVPYQLPTMAGFEGQSVTIFQVVEDQEDAVALSRTAEYFIEMGQLDPAAAVGQALRRYPADLGALVARAQVEIARRDTTAFNRTIELLKPRLSGGGDRGLLWDRRASLAVVLSRAKLPDLARAHVERCYAEIDEGAVRSLTTGALYRLQVLGKAYGLSIRDKTLRKLALDLLPKDMRDHLEH